MAAPAWRWPFALVGSAGLVLALLFGRLALAVSRSPGDDNPIGMLAFAATALAAVPSLGIALFIGRSELRRHWLWLAASVVSLAALGLVAWALWPMLAA